MMRNFGPIYRDHFEPEHEDKREFFARALRENSIVAHAGYMWSVQAIESTVDHDLGPRFAAMGEIVG